MKNLLYLSFVCLSLIFFTGCNSVDFKGSKLPAEDLEVTQRYADLIAILKNPSIPPNSKEKYDAARKLNKLVDLTFVRETKTLNDLFYHRDAIIDAPQKQDRQIAFNYQYKDHYIRFIFNTYTTFVVSVKIEEK